MFSASRSLAVWSLTLYGARWTELPAVTQASALVAASMPVEEEYGSVREVRDRDVSRRAATETAVIRLPGDPAVRGGSRAHRTSRTAALLQRIEETLVAELPILPFDAVAAGRYGELRAELERIPAVPDPTVGPEFI